MKFGNNAVEEWGNKQLIDDAKLPMMNYVGRKSKNVLLS